MTHESEVMQFKGDGRETTSIPITRRLVAPYQTMRTLATTLAIFIILLPVHLAMLFFFPMSFVPGGIRECYWWGVGCAQSAFIQLLVMISRQTTLVVTADDSIDLSTFAKKDQETHKMMLKGFSRRSVLMSNHQGYSDWVYAMTMLYTADLHSSIVIILKASLRKVPMAGPTMRLWKFLFLEQKWEKDRTTMGNGLHELGRRATKHDRPLTLLVYPEGTLVSKLTRPKSAAYAAKINQPDMRNQLLPRSTGLLFSLRTLLRTVPDLAFYDMTMGYPSMPPAAFAQSYYTLSSIYTASQGPPQIHIHLRQFRVDDGSVPALALKDKSATPEEVDDQLTAGEKEQFDTWLRERWTEKDELLDHFYKEKEFPAKEGQRVEIKLELRGIDDWLALLGTYAVVYLAWRMTTYGVRFLRSHVG